MKNKIDLILHPVRMRIITTLSGRKMTSQQIADVLTDIPQATLYRHIRKLLKGGVLTVTEKKQIRGTVEKTYTLSPQSNLNLTEDDLRQATTDDHIRYFTTFLTTMMADYTAYLQQDKVDPVDDGVGYHTLALYMDNDELQQFGLQLQQLIQSYVQPNGEKRRLFSFAIMPSVDERNSDDDN